jgi:hypothetical protein
MNANEELILRFYKAFQQCDWKTMQSCYHPDATFSDPAFRTLSCIETKAMWHMLCENAKDLKIEFSQVQADSTKGACQWQAWYTFSRTSRKVHNKITAQFKFKDGLIRVHNDTFNFWRWSRMALGISGLLLGWTPFLQKEVHESAYRSLIKFMQKHSEYLN